MSSGAQIFLVSACSSGEDFVAAFRRYVDRNGVVFVPIAEPLPAGRRGRFALTLSDGGVMIEGQAEVVSSARTPSVLHGRVGMTVKFVVPDEPSKTVLTELEKARLALKPTAPSVAPRAAEVPASPRPVPPPAGGRIDSVNALAECVVCGDVGSLSRDSDLGMPPIAMSTPASGRIPGPGPTRAAKQSVPPPIPRPPGHTTPPPFPAVRAKPASIPPPIPQGSVGKATTLGLSALDRTPGVDLTTTMRGPAPGVGLPQPEPNADKLDITQTLRGTMPPNIAAQIAEAQAAKAAAVDHEEEKTDLSDIPAPPRTPSSPLEIPEPPPVIEDLRDTAAMPALTEPVDPLGATATLSPIRDNAGITPVVEEASGDWTMTPGDVAPTPVAREGTPTGDWLIVLDPSRHDGWSEPSKVVKRPEGELPPGPPVLAVAGETPLDTSMMRAQPEMPVDDGPKIQVDASLSDVPIADAHGDHARLSAAIALPPAPSAGMPPITRPEAIPFGASASPLATIPGVGPVMVPPTFATPHHQDRLDPTDLRSGFFRESGDVQNLSGLHVPDDEGDAKKRRNIVIAVAVGGTLLVVLVLAAVLSSGTKPATTAPTTASPTATPAPSTTTNVPTPPTPPAPAATVDADIPPPTDQPLVTDEPSTPPTEAPPATTECTVKLTSVPSEALVTTGDKVLGTTPFELTLPCGSKQEVVLKKSKYATTTRKFTVRDNGKPVKLVLDKFQFTVRVSSTPSGATVWLGSKSLGVTPGNVKLPANETSTIKIAKEGYTPEVQKVTPKESNKLSVSVVLKKAVKAPLPKKR